MGSQSIDLVYELQGELNWDKEFASLACKEYSRWLELRAKTGDFQFCKLPPSRVVAMVWNLHRQWTLDYEKTCASLGGFIHHFPPAMRFSLPREQGYALTLQTYKSNFGEEPPASYWEPPICPSRPDVGPPGLLAQNIEQSENMETRLAGSPFQQCKPGQENDNSRMADATIGVQKSRGYPRLKRKSASTTQQTGGVLTGKQPMQEGSAREFPMERNALGDTAEPLSIAQSIIIAGNADPPQTPEERRIERRQGDTDAKEAKVIKTPRGGRKVQEGFVLRPLAPGEKRKRGRPSMSDYVPVTELAGAHEAGEKSILQPEGDSREQNALASSSPARSRRASLTIGRGRKGRSTAIDLPVQTLHPPQTADDGKLNYSGSAKHDFPSSDGKRSTATIGAPDASGRKNAEAGNKQPQSASVRIGPDGSILRRPRGRPRKDGSWPIPRAKRQQVSQSAQGRHSNSKLPPSSQIIQDASAKQEEYLPTALVTDADITHGDVPMSDLGAGVGQQIIDVASTDSNGAQL